MHREASEPRDSELMHIRLLCVTRESSGYLRRCCRRRRLALRHAAASLYVNSDGDDDGDQHRADDDCNDDAGNLAGRQPSAIVIADI